MSPIRKPALSAKEQWLRWWLNRGSKLAAEYRRRQSFH